MKKQKCFKCGHHAVWYYMPSDHPSDINYPANKYYCDSHVSRGCSCNLVHYAESHAAYESLTDEQKAEQFRDDFGRLLPCIEYDFNPEGYEEICDDE